MPRVLLFRVLLPHCTGFEELYAARLTPVYALHTLQRTGCKKEGLALLLKHGVFDDINVTKMRLNPYYCDRVCLAAKMRKPERARKN